MEELGALGPHITQIGIPALFFGIFCYALFKLVPKWIDVWKAGKEAERKRADQEAASMQEYYNERNKSYEAQARQQNQIMETLNTQIGQCSAVINRSNEVIAANTEAIKHNTAMHTKVIEALSNDIEATKVISASLKEHDVRSQKIYTNVQRILDKSETHNGF